MLNINMRFKNGILLISLVGIIDKKTSTYLDESITDLILENGIKYVALNLKNVKAIDKSGLDVILKNYKNIIKNEGKLIICGKTRSRINESLYEIESVDKVEEVISL